MAELAIARDMSAKFKAFSFPVIKSYSVVPVFRSSIIPRFPVSAGIGMRCVTALGFCLRVWPRIQVFSP